MGIVHQHPATKSSQMNNAKKIILTAAISFLFASPEVAKSQTKVNCVNGYNNRPPTEICTTRDSRTGEILDKQQCHFYSTGTQCQSIRLTPSEEQRNQLLRQKSLPVQQSTSPTSGANMQPSKYGGGCIVVGSQKKCF